MNRRDVLKVLAGTATALVSGAALALPKEPALSDLVSIQITIDPGEAEVIWVPDPLHANVNIPSSRLIDRANEAINKVLNERTLDYAHNIEITFDPFDRTQTKWEVKPEHFYKIRGIVVNRALTLHSGQMARRWVEIAVPEEDRTLKFSEHRRRIHAGVRSVRILIFVLPVSA